MAAYGFAFILYKKRTKLYVEGLILPWAKPRAKLGAFRRYEELKDARLVGRNGFWVLRFELPDRGPRFMLIRPAVGSVSSVEITNSKKAWAFLRAKGIPVTYLKET